MGWRGLAVFWAAVLVALGAGGAALQALGPPLEPAVKPVSMPAERSPPAEQHPPVAAPVPPPPATVPVAPRAAGASPSPPDPALMQPAPDYPGANLPIRAPDGRASMRVYARAFDAADRRPKIAMLVTGLGLSDSESRQAIDALPPPVSLGFSPYSVNPEPLLTAARARGHEYLVTLPMESQGYPLNNSGPQALMTGIDPADNARHLEWALSRMQGEVGATSASDGLRGERFAAARSAFDPVLRELADRGLLFVDARPRAAVSGAAVAVTTVVDDQPERNDLDAKLAELERRARDDGVAVGLAGRVRPALVDRIASWARGLDAKGIALVPVSALVAAR